MTDPRPRHEDGFSLIEVMMAVFIMAMATALVVLTLPGGRSPVETETKAFAAALERAADSALVSGQAYGVRLGAEGAGYSIVRREAGSWIDVERSWRALPDEVALIEIEPEARDADETPQGWPEIWFDPLGHGGAAAFDLAAGRERARVTVDTRGVQVERGDG